MCFCSWINVGLAKLLVFFEGLSFWLIINALIIKRKQITLLADETKTSKLFDLVFSSPALIVLHLGSVVVKASIHIIRVRQCFVSVFKERVKTNNTTVVTEGFTSNCDVTLPCTALFLITILLLLFSSCQFTIVIILCYWRLFRALICTVHCILYTVYSAYHIIMSGHRCDNSVSGINPWEPRNSLRWDIGLKIVSPFLNWHKYRHKYR